MNTCNAGWTFDSVGQGLLICDLLPPRGMIFDVVKISVLEIF
jgi:hypothetical protein